MVQDRMSSWNEEGELRGFDDWGYEDRYEDTYDVDVEDENPNLWEADVENLARLAGARNEETIAGGRHTNLVASAVSRWP
jgi:hypothetical protein